MKSLSALHRAWESFILDRALRQLCPTHPIVPKIVRRLADKKHAPSPLHPHDSIVTGASIVGALMLLGLSLAGVVR